MNRNLLVEMVAIAFGDAIVCGKKQYKDEFKYSKALNKISDKLINEIEKHEEACLGLATTGELLEEIKVRIEVDGKLNYRTVGGKNEDKKHS